MRRWDRLVEQFLEEYAARGVTAETVANVTRELHRWGGWLKSRRPRPRLEEVGPDLLVRYIQGRTAFRAKATVCTTVWILRSMGEFLVREGIWATSPLRWMRGPKLRPDCRVPRRINPSAMKRLLEGAATSRQGYYHRYLWLTIITLFYGTGIRRGELTRLNLTHWRRDEGLLLIDGRETGTERRVPVPTLRCGLEHLTLHQFRHSRASAERGGVYSGIGASISRAAT